MTDQNQIFVFLVCVACGIGGGFVYDVIYCARYPFRKSWVRITTDVIFCLFFAALYLFVSVMMELPGLRFYSFVGCVLGLFLYLKSFHKIVAFFMEKVYNKLVKSRKEKPKCQQKKRRICRKKSKSASLSQ
jgi:uncharacterized membrane protein